MLPWKQYIFYKSDKIISNLKKSNKKISMTQDVIKRELSVLSV